jgi:uroporphyrin-III C-methyltransferase
VLNNTLVLVGAGPGDEDLITVKGLNAIKNAKSILYDALVNPSLLKHAPKDIPVVFVGKRRGQHYLTQDEINELIVEHAKKYGSVLRLKGGDPFVFGRGFEELLFAQKHNIETEYIPGISSSIGVLGLNDIPVTHRGSSESFWVITGTNKDRKLSNDIQLAAQSTATVVILMGLSKLEEIVALFKKHNKAKMDIAIIQKGSLPEENIVYSTIETIIEDVKENDILPPAVIVIGDVVKVHQIMKNNQA